MRDVYQDIEFLERYKLNGGNTEYGEEGEIYHIALSSTLKAIGEAKENDNKPVSRFQYGNATEMAQALEAMGNGGLTFQTEVAEQIPRMHRAIQANLYRLALKILAALALEIGAEVDERNRFAVSGARRIVGACRSEFV